MISALQHHSYCARQCALIHVENVSDETPSSRRHPSEISLRGPHAKPIITRGSREPYSLANGAYFGDKPNSEHVHVEQTLLSSRKHLSIVAVTAEYHRHSCARSAGRARIGTSSRRAVRRCRTRCARSAGRARIGTAGLLYRRRVWHRCARSPVGRGLEHVLAGALLRPAGVASGLRAGRGLERPWPRPGGGACRRCAQSTDRARIGTGASHSDLFTPDGCARSTGRARIETRLP